MRPMKSLDLPAPKLPGLGKAKPIVTSPSSVANYVEGLASAIINRMDVYLKLLKAQVGCAFTESTRCNFADTCNT